MAHPRPELRIDEAITRDPFPKARKIYVEGRCHPDVRVPMREIRLSPTITAESVRVLKDDDPVMADGTSGSCPDHDVEIGVRCGDTSPEPQASSASPLPRPPRRGGSSLHVPDTSSAKRRGPGNCASYPC